MQKIFFIFLILFCNTFTQTMNIKFDTNLSNEYKIKIATFIKQNFNKPNFKKKLTSRFKEIKNFKIIKKIKNEIIKINTYPPILTINNQHVLTSKNISDIKNYNIETEPNIEVKNFDFKNKTLIDFLLKLEPYVLSKYKIIVESDEKVVLEDKKHKEFFITCTTKKPLRNKILQACKDIQKEKIKEKNNRKKINTDIRFKDQIIISYG